MRAISHGIEDIERATRMVSDMPVSCWESKGWRMMLTPIQFIELLAVFVIILYTAMVITCFVMTDKEERNLGAILVYTGSVFIFIMIITALAISKLTAH